MKKFAMEWSELRRILHERPDPQEVYLMVPYNDVPYTFKFVKDIEGEILRIKDPDGSPEYFQREGKFVIQDTKTKKKYSCSYSEDGNSEDDLQLFDKAPFYFYEYTDLPKRSDKPKRATAKSDAKSDFRKQVSELKLVIDTRPRVYVTWVNTEDGRDRVDTYERMEINGKVCYNNFHNRGSFIFPDHKFWNDLEYLYKKAKKK